MALAEEFVQTTQPNSDDASPSTSFNGETNGGEKNNAREQQQQQQQKQTIVDVLANTALSTVTSFARVVGSASPDGDGDSDLLLNDEKYGVADGYTTGANGIVNVFSGSLFRGRMGPASRRSRLIRSQRRSLNDGLRQHRGMVNRVLGDNAGGTGAAEGSGGGGATAASARGAADENEGRMTPLVAALSSAPAPAAPGARPDEDSTLITTALQTLERDMAFLDNEASLRPQLSGTEVGLLLGAVLASGVGPIAFPGTSVTELLAPAAAAFTASITIGSEYIGRVAVADGKEIAANTIQCAAEAEAFLANAERVKAITPLCVGICATCASFALLVPTVVEALNVGRSVVTMTELYLLCPLVSVLSAAVANLALEETRRYATRAINVGVRRFSKKGMVGQTWLSSVEQVKFNSQSKTAAWINFAGTVLPAPVIGSLLGGPSLSTKCIVVAALAAAQSAYFLAQAESVVARATDAVALKARSAAVCDTYANQGARNSAILPFTSALSAFCAAATAATVELPFLDTISTLYGTAGEVVLVSAFPILSSAFAAAAAVSKARCEVDAEAAAQAASTLALEYDGMNGGGDDPVLRPFQAVKELVLLAVTSGLRSIKYGVVTPLGNIWKIGRSALMGFRWRRRSGDNERRGLA